MRELQAYCGGFWLRAFWLTCVCTSCGAASETDSLRLDFRASIGGQSLRCGQSYGSVGTAASSVRVKDLRLYLSDFRFVLAEGGERPVPLRDAPPWQSSAVALLDFEDASGDCAEFGTVETNDQLLLADGTSLEGVTGLRFTLGVPEELNHQDAATAVAPLNLGALQWNWQAGYKFIRLDLLHEGAPATTPWLVHLGSTGCQSAGPAVAPATACARSNRVEVELAQFDLSSPQIALDLGRMLADVDLGHNTPDTAPGCMSGATDPECASIFAALGLASQGGDCVDACAAQRLFTTP